MKKIAKVVVDTSVIIKAFESSSANNRCRDFLELFVEENKAGDKILYLCTDLPPSSIYKEYEQAIRKLPRSEAIAEFESWYHSVGHGHKAISAEDGSIDELSWHKTVLENEGCQKETELIFVARAFYNKEENNNGILVAENCDIREFQKMFFKESIGQHLSQQMDVNIVSVEGALKWIQFMWDQEISQNLMSPRTEVKRLMKTYFNLDDLDNLIFDLNLRDNIPGETNEVKARELIEYCERHNLVDALILWLRNKRPFVTWPDPWSLA